LNSPNSRQGSSIQMVSLAEGCQTIVPDRS
jgi:hypothetical protein